MSVARRYTSGCNLAAVASTFKTAGTIVSAATVRPKIFEFTVGTDLGASANDNIDTWALQRFTAAGTTSAITPTAIDPADPAALASAGSNATVEPTYTANLFLWGPMGVNQRATYRWVAAPDGELVMPATAANGLGMQVKSAGYTGQADVVLMHAE